MKVENLLTQEEIQEVLRQAPIYSRRRFANGAIPVGMDSRKRTSVQKLSVIHELILIWGDEDTGFCHIHNRHHNYENKTYWKDENKPDQPSRFRDSYNSFDILEAADSVYSVGAKNIKKKVPGFDNYIGKHKDEDGNEDEYILVLYENTKVIHTMYPTKPLANIKHPDKFSWNRGDVTMTDYLGDDVVEIKVPYIRENGVTAYTISFLQNTKLKREKCAILIHDETGKDFAYVELGERWFTPIQNTKFKDTTFSPQANGISTMLTFQRADLRNLERIIMQIDKDPGKPKPQDRP
jgi:hypothetical protein